jgi:erythromycin esterase
VANLIFNKKKQMKLITILFMLTILSISCDAQYPLELKKYAAGFDGLTSSSFSFLDEELDDVTIVGYGEDTHGSAEFTILAEELMKYLSAEHGFKILIIENGFGEVAYFNDYIQGKSDDLNAIFKKYNSSWRYKTVEFYHLLNWLRDYNQNNTDKIYLYGCEMQYVISDVNRIKDYLKLVNADYQIDGFEKHLWQNIEAHEKMDYYISYAKLKAYFIANYKTFKNKTSEEEFNLAYHHIEVLGQFTTAINQNVEQRKYDFRDIYMGENIQWILDFHGADAKALYWAHNAHVGDWISNGIVDVAGHQLKKMYGESYFSIATDFGTGAFIAFPHNANEIGWNLKTFEFDMVLENTFTNSLKTFGKPNTFLNLRKAKQDADLKMFLENPLIIMSGAGAQARSSTTETVDIGKAFDGIIYLNEINSLNWSE